MPPIFLFGGASATQRLKEYMCSIGFNEIGTDEKFKGHMYELSRLTKFLCDNDLPMRHVVWKCNKCGHKKRDKLSKPYKPIEDELIDHLIE